MNRRILASNKRVMETYAGWGWGEEGGVKDIQKTVPHIIGVEVSVAMASD